MVLLAPRAQTALASCGFALVGVLAVAQTAAAARVTFDQVLELGGAAPAIRATQAERTAREREDRGVGGTLGPTSITVMPGAALTPGQGADFDFQLNATQGWNLQGLGAKARETAGLERQTLGVEQRLVALETRLAAARLWIELRTVEELEGIVARGVELAQQGVQLARRGKEAGVSTDAQLREAEAIRAELEAQSLALEGRHFEVENQLRNFVPTSEADPQLVTAGSWPEPVLPLPAEIRAAIARLDALPQVALAEMRKRAAAARALEIAATRAPLLTVGAQVERGTGNVWVGYGILGVTFNGPQGQRAVSVARAADERGASELELARRAARADFSAAAHEWEHTEQTLALLEKQTLPSLEALVVARRRALDLGEETRATGIEAERRLRAAQEMRVEAQGRAVLARVRLWLLLASLRRGEP